MFQTMSGRHAYLLALVLSVASVSSAGAQEVLQPARIQAKASRRQPALGLPKRLGSQTDPVVWYVSGEWKGADSLKGVPFWTMAQVSEPAQGGELTQVLQLCAKWASEKPKRAVDIVWGVVFWRVNRYGTTAAASIGLSIRLAIICFRNYLHICRRSLRK